MDGESRPLGLNRIIKSNESYHTVLEDFHKKYPISKPKLVQEEPYRTSKDFVVLYRQFIKNKSTTLLMML